MRARAVAGGMIASAAIVMIGWHIGSDEVAATTTSAPSASGSASPSPAASSRASAGAPGSSATTTTPVPSSSPTSSSVSGTFDGTTAETRYGPVQVAIVVAGGKITDVTALQLTNQGGRSVQISNEAAPILRREALSAQSANIQSVSGATFTSEGYATSLQAAIDKAGI